MKSIVKFFILSVCICLLDSCKETEEEGNKPDAIVEYDIIPIHGGATITYTLPNDRNIQFVIAEYERNGAPFMERASRYNNSITIEGFNTTNPVSATLYTVSRDDEVKSDPLRIEFIPLESVVSLATQSIHIIPAFGGILVSWENISKTELGVRLMVKEDSEMIEKEMYFSSLVSGSHTFRGFESEEISFAMTFEDKWGNISDTIYYTGTPLFEVEIPKPWNDLRTLIPYDNISNLYGQYLLSNIWNGLLGLDNRYLTELGSEGSSFTFDLNQVVKLSRIIMWPTVYRPYPAIMTVYQEVHILEFEMWGCKELDYSKLPPADPSYWLHPFSAEQNGTASPWKHPFSDLKPEDIQALPNCFAKDWIYLGRYQVERLDLMGASDEDIYAQGEAGWQWDIPIECEPVRIIRFFPIASYSGSPPPNNYWQINEMSFFGDNTIPQE